MPDSVTAACFIDTNIWLYAFVDSDSDPRSAAARILIRNAAPVVSTQVVNEVCVNLLSKASFSEAQVAQLIESFYDKYPVVELSRAILIHASHLRQHHSFSFWDSMIVAAALSTGVPVLYSEDMQDGLTVGGQLRIRNPFRDPQ